MYASLPIQYIISEKQPNRTNRFTMIKQIKGLMTYRLSKRKKHQVEPQWALPTGQMQASDTNQRIKAHIRTVIVSEAYQPSCN